jgi:hypothetical protein
MASYIFEGLFAEIIEAKVELTNGVFLHSPGDADTAWMSQSFKSGGDVDAITENISALGDDVALVDTNSKLDPFRLGIARVASSHLLLHLGRTA